MDTPDSPDTSTVLEQDGKRQRWSVMAAAAYSPGLHAWPETVHCAYVSANYEKARHQLKQLKQLSNDWDGYGALRVAEEALQNALTLVNSACVQNWSIDPPGVAPNPNGTVSLEWQHGDREAYFEVGNTRASGYCRFPNQPTLYLHGPTEVVTPALTALVSLLSQSARPLAPTLGQYHSSSDDADTP